MQFAQFNRLTCLTGEEVDLRIVLGSDEVASEPGGNFRLKRRSFLHELADAQTR